MKPPVLLIWASLAVASLPGVEAWGQRGALKPSPGPSAGLEAPLSVSGVALGTSGTLAGDRGTGTTTLEQRYRIGRSLRSDSRGPALVVPPGSPHRSVPGPRAGFSGSPLGREPSLDDEILAITPGVRHSAPRPAGANALTTGPGGRTFTTRPFGSGAITTGPEGKTWTTRPFGNGSLTIGPGGKTYTSRPFGSGTITTGPDGQTWTTRPFGDGTITTGPGGQTLTTRPFGSGTITTGPGGNVWTTRPIGGGPSTVRNNR